MKNLIIGLTLLVVNFSVNAQTIVPVENMLNSNSEINNVYYKDVNGVLNKYIGTWVYDSEPYYLKVIVGKITNQSKGVKLGELFTGNVSEDFIQVRYQFKIDGVEKYNTIGLTEYWITNGNVFVDSTTRKIKLNHIEPSLSSNDRGRIAELVLEYIVGSPEQLKWNWKYVLGGRNFAIYPNGEAFDQSDYLIPNNIILTKQ